MCIHKIMFWHKIYDHLMLMDSVQSEVIKNPKKHSNVNLTENIFKTFQYFISIINFHN